MDIPVAVPVGSCDGAKIEPFASELYVLEQHQEALRLAEKELERTLAAAEDFFSTPQERDSTYTEIQQRPDAVYDKPFKRKIAHAFLEVKRCKYAVEWTTDSVVDTSLTPAQVKAQVKQLLEAQRIYMEERISEESSILKSEMKKLRQELEEERKHRLAFQAKVKDFSEDVYMTIFVNANHSVIMKHDSTLYRDDDGRSCSAKIMNVPRQKLGALLQTQYRTSLMNKMKIQMCVDHTCQHNKSSCCTRADLTSHPLYVKYNLDSLSLVEIEQMNSKCITTFDGSDP